MRIILISVILFFIIFSFEKTVMNFRSGKNLLQQPPDTIIPVTVKSEVTHKNLVIYFLKSEHKLDQINYVTLSEALDKKYATLVETGTVNTLSIINNSKEFIFINAGDIVKGGRQDRTIGVDIIIPPFEKKTDLVSFCVESSRWTKRGNESAAEFSSNEEILPSRTLKISARKEKDQSAVWSGISDQQNKLNTNVSHMKGSAVDIRSVESQTSLQLTLENKDLDSLRKVYRGKFETIPLNDEEIVGFAYSVNGELFGADIYNNRELFKKMWPKLLNSIVVEAITEYKGDTAKFGKPGNIIASLSQCYSGVKNIQEVNKITRSVSFETDKGIAFETYDLNHKDWLHKSYIMKDPNQKSEPKTDFNRMNYRNNINNSNQNNIEQRIENNNE